MAAILRKPNIFECNGRPTRCGADQFGVAIAAVMLVAGELYLVTRPDPAEINAKPPAVVTSSVEQNPR
jgi:hypothetical protein